MSENKHAALVAATYKPFYKSNTFLATISICSMLVFCFWLVLFFDLDVELQAKVLSSIILAISIVGLSYIAPKIVHDVLTRLPAIKGAMDANGAAQVYEKKEPEAASSEPG